MNAALTREEIADRLEPIILKTATAAKSIMERVEADSDSITPKEAYDEFYTLLDAELNKLPEEERLQMLPHVMASAAMASLEQAMVMSMVKDVKDAVRGIKDALHDLNVKHGGPDTRRIVGFAKSDADPKNN